MATTVSLEERVALLERRVAELQSERAARAPGDRDWLEAIYGRFKNDPIFAEAVRLGRTYRRSSRGRKRRRRPAP
jgi:hypothetical protein